MNKDDDLHTSEFLLWRDDEIQWFSDNTDRCEGCGHLEILHYWSVHPGLGDVMLCRLPACTCRFGEIVK